MSIEFKEGAVCFAKGEQWFANEVESLTGESGRDMEIDSPIEFEDFQLNTINKGDYIKASEFGTEQKYNDVVEVFGLFGFDVSGDFEWFKDESCRYNLFFIDECKDLDSCVKTYGKLKRKLTFQQIIAIGELKRLMDERDNLTPEEEIELKCRVMASELDSQDDEWPKIDDEVDVSGARGVVVDVNYTDKIAIVKFNRLFTAPVNVDSLKIVESLTDGEPDEWPQVGDGITYQGVTCEVELPADKSGHIVIVKDGNYCNPHVDDVKKPKSKEDLLIEELQTKLIENNALDTWMLAANIVNGDIEGLSYKGDSDD